MSRLYLVRHARTRVDPQRPVSEWDLDPSGLGLLAALAGLPHWAGVTRVFSSSEPKALRTAEAIALARGMAPPEPLDALRELRKATFVADHDAVMAELFRFPDRPAAPGWESAAGALLRFSEAIRELLQQSEGQDIAVVSHGTVLALYLAQLQHQRQVAPADWQAIGMPDFCVVELESMRVVEPFGAWRAPEGQSAL